MKAFTNKFFISLGIFLSIFCASMQLEASKVKEAKKRINEYFQEFPYLGLVTDEIKYGPVRISHVHINHADKVALVSPGETLHGSLRYQIDSDQFQANLYHLVVGLEGVGPQDCITHTFNIFDSDGKGHFTLTAPLQPGVYEVRFMIGKGLTCKGAQEAWDARTDVSSFATIGIVIVQ